MIKGLILVVVYYFGMTNHVMKEEVTPYATLEDCLRDAAEMNKQMVRDYEGVPGRFEASCRFYIEEEIQ
jgi:hypothetical protein